VDRLEDKWVRVGETAGRSESAFDHSRRMTLFKELSLKGDIRGVLEAGGGGDEECWLGFILPCTGHRPDELLPHHSGCAERAEDGATPTQDAIPDYFFEPI